MAIESYNFVIIGQTWTKSGEHLFWTPKILCNFDFFFLFLEELGTKRSMTQGRAQNISYFCMYSVHRFK